MKTQVNTLTQKLDELKNEAKKKKGLTFREVISHLGIRSKAILIILLSLPFCIPQIPGFSTPFGIAIAFTGLSIAFNYHIWLPKILLDRVFSEKSIEKIVNFTSKSLKKIDGFLYSRLHILVSTTPARIVNGLIIVVLGILLALPLPIPFSNMLVAIPLCLIGLGLIIEDGVLLIFAYILTVFGIALFSGAFWISYEALKRLFIWKT